MGPRWEPLGLAHVGSGWVLHGSWVGPTLANVYRTQVGQAHVVPPRQFYVGTIGYKCGIQVGSTWVLHGLWVGPTSANLYGTQVGTTWASPRGFYVGMSAVSTRVPRGLAHVGSEWVLHGSWVGPTLVNVYGTQVGAAWASPRRLWVGSAWVLGGPHLSKFTWDPGGSRLG